MKKIALFLSFALTGCGHMAINVDSTELKGKTGILVTASHLKQQTFLYLNQGAQVSLNDSEPLVVPWGESKFIELDPGSQNYKIWFNYSGKSGLAQDCVIIPPDQTILLEYKTPATMFQSGKVQLKNMTSETPVERC